MLSDVILKDKKFINQMILKIEEYLTFVMNDDSKAENDQKLPKYIKDIAKTLFPKVSTILEDLLN
jgi:hypothetical protein